MGGWLGRLVGQLGGSRLTIDPIEIIQWVGVWVNGWGQVK